MRIKSEQKVIVNWFCASIILKNPISGFSIWNILYNFYRARILIINRIFSIRKTGFNRIIKDYWHTKLVWLNFKEKSYQERYSIKKMSYELKLAMSYT